MKYDLSEMYSLDIFLSSLSNEEYNKIKHEIKGRTTPPMSLVSWEFFMDGYYQRMTQSKKKSELKQVLTLAKEFNWKNNLKLAFSENDYEALIITDKNQKIIWVNEGFTSMTGYSKKYALDKTPRFLQGEHTSLETKQRIKTKIILNQPFKDTIINHRKDNTTYKCEVKIFPLYSKETTHYIAFEKQVV